MNNHVRQMKSHLSTRKPWEHTMYIPCPFCGSSQLQGFFDKDDFMDQLIRLLDRKQIKTEMFVLADEAARSWVTAGLDLRVERAAEISALEMASRQAAETLQCAEIALSGNEFDVEAMKKHLTDHVLVSICPNNKCKQQWTDFTGCTVLQCSHCEVHFCFWCCVALSSSDSLVRHAHASACSIVHLEKVRNLKRSSPHAKVLDMQFHRNAPQASNRFEWHEKIVVELNSAASFYTAKSVIVVFQLWRQVECTTTWLKEVLARSWASKNGMTKEQKEGLLAFVGIQLPGYILPEREIITVLE
jgi:hypothetical protein